MIEGPLQDLHAAEGAADGGEHALDAEVLEQAALHLDEVGDREDGEAQAVRRSGRRID